MSNKIALATIQFRADAKGANAALESLRQSAKDARSTMNEMQDALNKGIKTIKDSNGVEFNVADRLRDATRQAKSFEQSLRELMKGATALETVVKNIRMGEIESSSRAELKGAINAAESRKRSVRGTDEQSLKIQRDLNTVIEESRKQLNNLDRDTAKVIETILQGSNISQAVLDKEQKGLREILSLIPKGTEEWNKYNAQLQSIEAHVTNIARQERESATKLLSSQNLGQYSETDIRKAIEAGKQLIQTYRTAGPEAKTIAENIVRAEEHLKQYGIEAERAARKEALAVTDAAKKREETHLAMENQLRRGTDLTQSSLKQQESYWQRLIDDPKAASNELSRYFENLNKVHAIQKEQEASATKAGGLSALNRLRSDMDYENKVSANQLKEDAAALKAWHDSLQRGGNLSLLREIEYYIRLIGNTAERAATQTISLADAEALAGQLGTKGFTASTEKLKLAKKVLEEAQNAAGRGGERFSELQAAINRVNLELSKTGGLSSEVQAVLNQPKGRSFNELKQAVDQGRDALQNMRTTTKEEQKAFDELAEKVKEADTQMKNLGSSSKGVASNFEKAWSRLKTYVGVYVGAAVAMQKMMSTTGEVMELSDKLGEVRKTTGFTADEVGRLSENLAKLDTRTTITELLGLSAAAGQLGLKTEEDVRGFTEAANMLMVALPEMGREGATEMLKVALATGEIDKIRQQMQDGVIEGSSATAVAMTKIGSTIDQLRANSAAAAPQITDFVKRVGAVGAQSGISIDQVAALGATVDALGMRVEMSATALSRMIPAIKNNSFAIGRAIEVTQDWIDEQFRIGNGMEVILKVFDHIRKANLNADDIEQMFGSSMGDIMKELNQQGARAGIVFSGLSQGVGQLRANLATAKEAYEDNIAIMQEYSKMNETTAAKWERLKNQVEEVFVNDSSQRFFGYIITGLRWIVNFLTGNVAGAFRVVTAALQAFIFYWSTLKLGLGEALFVKAAAGLKEMGSNLVHLISNTKQYITYSIALKKAHTEQARAAIEAEMAQKGLNKAMIANVWMALIAAVIAAGVAIYKWATSVETSQKSLSKANAEVDKAKDRFEGYYQKLNDTSKALKSAQSEHSKLSKEIDKLRRSTDGSAESTENLKKKEDELKASENNLTKVQGDHSNAIAEMNSIYGKYLGFLLTEENYARMAAAAHDKVTAAIEREMLMKQRQAAIENVKSETQEDYIEDLASFSEDLLKIGGLNGQQVSQVRKALLDYLKNFSYDAKSGKFNIESGALEQFKSWGINPEKFSANKLAAIWVSKYLQDTFHMYEGDARRITGMTVRQSNGKIKSTDTFLTGWASNLRANYLNTFFDRMKKEIKVSNVFEDEIEAARSNENAAAKKIVDELVADANASIEKINKKGTKSKDIDTAYGKLANSILGLEQQIRSLDQQKDAQEIRRINNLIEETRKKVDKKRLTEARNKAQATLFEQATWSGDTADIGAQPSGSPYGSYNRVTSPYSDWNADDLVARRKEMLERVRSLANGADVQAVLSKDAKFITDATRNNIKTTRDAIEWYNTERLKIQEALYAKHLTNTGDWRDPEKGRKNWKRQLQTDFDSYLRILDAYYTERKAHIQASIAEEGLSEAEAQRLTIENETVWRKHRIELQQIYQGKSEQIAGEERKRIYDILAKQDEDSAEFVEASIEKSLKKMKLLAEKSEVDYNTIMSKLTKDIAVDLYKQQNAVAKQMEAITAIIAKERPFNGLTENLQANLSTMGILFADFDKKRKEMLAASLQPEDDTKQRAENTTKRMLLLLTEAEHAYSLTWEQLKAKMETEGLGDWAGALEVDEQKRQAVIASLHSFYDQVQDAIKKEAGQIKKQAEILWNELVIPGADKKSRSMKSVFDETLSQLGLQEGRVSRANSLIGAGQSSERVADKLAIQQLKVRMAMQDTYYKIVKSKGADRIEKLEAEAKLLEAQGKLEEASIKRLDVKHAKTALALSDAEEQTKIMELQNSLAEKVEESQMRLYKELRTWGELLYSSIQGVFEASNAGNAEYYNELAKLNLTGSGGPGAGTYVIIDNAGTADASARYEYLDEREALERQHEIEQQNAVAEAWKKVMDEINSKMAETITDQMNAMVQNVSIDANTQATLANTEATIGLTGALNGLEGSAVGTPNASEPQPAPEGNKSEWLSPLAPSDGTNSLITKWDELANAGKTTAAAIGGSLDNVANKTKETNAKMTKSTQSTFATMIQAANLYGIAYNAMSNSNMSASQKASMIAIQAAGNAAIAGLNVAMAEAAARAATDSPGVLGKLWKTLGPIGGSALFAVFSGVLGGLMGLAASKISKSKSEITQTTGVSGTAGRLTTGMMTYADGNVNEFTDPSSLTPGRSYNVDAADGKTYRARYMGENPRTHITNGPEFHLVGEAGREAIIDARTTRLMQMDDVGIWQAIKTLYNGGRVAASHSSHRRGSVRAFAGGNLDDFDEISNMEATGGMDVSQILALQASIDRQSDLLEDLRRNGIKATFDVYGKGGLVDSYDTGKKTVNRHGERY